MIQSKSLKRQVKHKSVHGYLTVKGRVGVIESFDFLDKLKSNKIGLTENRDE